MDGQVTAIPPRKHGLLVGDQLRHRSRELTRAFSSVRAASRGSASEILPLESRADLEIVRGVD
jgi:hypothetical protein